MGGSGEEDPSGVDEVKSTYTTSRKINEKEILLSDKLKQGSIKFPPVLQTLPSDVLERFVFGYNKENSSPQLRQGSCHLFVQIEQEPRENSVLVNLATFQPGEEPLGSSGKLTSFGTSESRVTARE